MPPVDPLSAVLSREDTIRTRRADRVTCPRCNEPLRRVTVGEGVLVVTCSAKLEPRAGQRYGDPCAQRFLIIGSPHRTAQVIPITKAEAEVLTARGVPRPEEALEILGILQANDARRAG